MDTDEYEISLSRELDVCNSTIRKIRKSLREMEKKYAMPTEEFAEAYQKGQLSADNKDFEAWFNGSEALRTWEKRKADFEAVYRRMKI
jgi:hypothetical protein